MRKYVLKDFANDWRRVGYMGAQNKKVEHFIFI